MALDGVVDSRPSARSSLYFFPKRAAFNIQWRAEPERIIKRYVEPAGVLTKPGMENHTGSHADWYEGWPDAAQSTAMR